MKNILIGLTSLALAAPAWAEKAGPYIGVGITSNVYRSSDSDINEVFESEGTTGWRLEGGHIWDLGKPGGFHLGVVGAYNNFGQATATGELEYFTFNADVEAQAISALFVIEQEIVRWVDFVFKIGPAFVDYELRDTGYDYFYGPYSNNYSNTAMGTTAVIGFTFFPTQFLAIELASQGTAFLDSEVTDDVFAISSLSLSIQYRI